MPWGDNAVIDGRSKVKRSLTPSVFAARHLRLGHAASLLRQGNRGRGMPAVGYVLEPRPAKVDDKGRARIPSSRRAPTSS
jgi:hypothetical protein